jgi:hypothetical protein
MPSEVGNLKDWFSFQDPCDLKERASKLETTHTIYR